MPARWVSSVSFWRGGCPRKLRALGNSFLGNSSVTQVGVLGVRFLGVRSECSQVGVLGERSVSARSVSLGERSGIGVAIGIGIDRPAPLTRVLLPLL